MTSTSEQSFESFLKTNNLLTINDFSFAEVLVGGGTNFTAIYKNDFKKAVAKFFFIGPHEVMLKKYRNEIENHKQSRMATPVLPEFYSEFSSNDGFIRGYLMEYVDGYPLSHILDNNDLRGTYQKIAVFYRVGWAYHRTLSGLVHGDLHPTNIIFETTMDDWLSRKPESPEVRILDLGASISPLRFSYEETFDEHLWQDFRRRYSGSFYSLAPEFFSSNYNQIIQSPGVFDCWALGLLLFKIATGTLLQIADSVGEYVELIHADELQLKIENQINLKCDNYYLKFLLNAMLRVDVSQRLSLRNVIEYANQLYNENEHLVSKKEQALYQYVYREGCDPEFGLPPHERSDSPY